MSFSLIQEAEDESMSYQMEQFSEDDNFIFAEDIQTNYQDSAHQKQYLGWLSESYINSESLVNFIIKKVLKKCEERTILRDIPIHSSNYVRTLTDSLVFLCIEYGQTDIKGCLLLEDQEPRLIYEDSWSRNIVTVTTKDNDKYEALDQVENMNATSKSYLYSTGSRTSILYRPSTDQAHKKNIKSNESLTSSKHNRDPKPVALPQDEDEDEFQDKLRNVKNFEQKKRTDADIKKKTEKLKIPILERGQQGPKKFIYDFDGTLLTSKVVKIEKLSPANYLINFNILEPKLRLDASLSPRHQKKVKGSKLEIADTVPKQKVQNKNLEERKENAKEVLGDKAIKPTRDSQFPYENFNMNSGVTLFFESRTKDGQRSQITDSIEALSNKLSGQNITKGDHSSQNKVDPLRLTKTEYQLVTQHGQTQILAPKAYILEQPSQLQQSKILTDQSLITALNATPATLKFQTQTKTTDEFNKQSVIKNNSHVKLGDNKFLHRLTGEDDQQDKVKSNNTIVEKIIPPKVKNPIDQFNQTLLLSKDWGKMGISHTLPPLKMNTPKVDTSAHKSSLEQLYKMPRDRMNAQNLRGQIMDQSANNGVNKNKKTYETEYQTFYTTHSQFPDKLRYK